MGAYDGATLVERVRGHFGGSTDHLYGVLMMALADDFERGGVTREILRGYDDAPAADMVQLRLLAGLHRIVLRGDAPELAAFYPSMGGQSDRYAVWPVAERVLRAHVGEVRDALKLAPQTNEVGRSLALLVGLSEVVRRTGLSRVRLLEPGASAGLNLLVDRYRFVGDGWSAGPAGADVVITGCGAAGFTPEPFSIVSRRGCDLAPLDAADPSTEIYLRSFVWPHMPERDHRLVGALATARQHPVVVDRSPAAQWVRDQLRSGPQPGEVTVVWHSITRQYWPPSEVEGVQEAVAEARTRMPLAQVSLEDPQQRPDSGEWQPQVEVDVDVIAHCLHHGPPLALVPHTTED